MHHELAAAALAALTALAPHPWQGKHWPAWLVETQEHYDARLRSIAEDVDAESQTLEDVALLVGAGGHESAFAWDVDGGMPDGSACYREDEPRRCDGGHAWSIWQRHDLNNPERGARWRTRRNAAHDALALLRQSRRVCAYLGPARELGMYAGGHCAEGGEIARRAGELRAWFERALRAAGR